MNRRWFLKALGLGALSAPFATPALGQAAAHERNPVLRSVPDVYVSNHRKDLTVGDVRRCLAEPFRTELVLPIKRGSLYLPGGAS